MTISIHPLQTTTTIRESYLRYLKTIYPFQQRDLREQFWHALETPDLLVKGPLLEASPPFQTGRSIQAMVGDGLLHPRFETLCSDAFPYERPLYLHQDQGIDKVVRGQRNVVVATGTGSGKTETFLVPVLDHLLHEEGVGTLGLPGVRALFLYPMNALANDQLRRLRRLLAGYPTITFGRYTGETRERQGEAEAAFLHQFPRDPLLPNELISRERLRAAPPHILLTNYAMLEYLLLRPVDCEFFDGETGRHWRFLVIDEAHVYDGASGIEIAMLIRRLKDRVVRSEPGRLRCIGTSATLGRGREDYPLVARFAREAFGEPFEWRDDDPERQDVVAATHLPMEEMGTPWGMARPDLYRALRRALPIGESVPRSSIDVLAHAAGQAGVPTSMVESAAREAAALPGPSSVDRFLYAVLRGDERLHVLQARLAEAPRFLHDLAADLFPERADAAERLIELVDLAVRARPEPSSISLLPARYHVFARALEGAFACLHTNAHQGTEESPPRLFLTRRKSCPHCGAHVVELATCVRCGVAYVVGSVVHESGREGAPTLRQLTGQADDAWSETAYFMLGEQIVGLDEDEAVGAGEDLERVQESECAPYTLCLGCGAIVPREHDSSGCECAPSAPKVALRRVDLGDSPELRHCVSCGARSTRGVVYRFLTGQDAPVSVLATSLYQVLPPSTEDEMAGLPGEGRKLLAFSDSRQDAAFFAPYLERTYGQLLRRRLILKTLLEDEAGRQGVLRLQDVVGRLLQQAEGAGLFVLEQSYDERQRLMWTWLMQELVAWDRRISLEGLGLLRFRLVRPVRWRPPAPFLAPPWSLTEEEAWQLLETLLDTLRHQGAVTFPQGVDVREEAFAPRNRVLYMRQERADAARGIYSWVPTRGSNRRLDILARLLTRISPLPEEERTRLALDTLKHLWAHLTEPRSAWRDHLPSENLSRIGVVHRISHALWEAVPSAGSDGRIYRCGRCHAVSYTNVRGICASYRCHGTLEPIDAGAVEWAQNHYRHLYQHLEPIPLSAEEHTAQWTGAEAATVQDSFVRGEVNALSCSTTFELGVDVGELQAVLMRNVPPTTANYVQRAGRAGRRTDSAAFALTYAQRRSHDLTHYAHPERMVSGRIHPPVVVVSNEKIVRRHVQSVLFSAFFRWAYHQQDLWYRSVGDFFAPEGPGPAGPELLRQYVDGRPAEVRDALARIVPPSLQGELGIDDWTWLPNLWDDEGNGILERVTDEVKADLDLLRQLEEQAAAQRNYRQSDHFQRVARTVRSRDLLGFLGSRNVLPKYGFPTDVVEMRTNHLTVPQAGRIELQRDLRIAISEYAPGGQVVAAKHIWTSGGLNTRPGRNWPAYHYAVCPECGRFHHALSELEGPCVTCGANLYSGWPRRYGTFVIPEFGFIVSEEPRPSGEARPERFHYARVYFADYARPEGIDGREGEPPFAESPLSSAVAQVWQRYSRYGQLAVVNAGWQGRGFRVCELCGFAEPAPLIPTGRRRRAPAAHANPRTGEPCRGTIHTWHLGHQFMTDVLELRFDGRLAATVDRELWFSVLYALLEGASEALGIRRDDLDGTLYPYGAGIAPALVLFDDVPGGAGHVRRIAEALPAVFHTTWVRVDGCECGEETSCYECLRNFRNQPFHDLLQRGLARDFLGELLQSAGVTLEREA